MERYKIIDEPRAKPWGEHLILDPTIILFVAILVPLFWQPPYQGRFWIPMLWLVFNGYALGSSTLVKEIVTLVLGSACGLVLVFGVSYLIGAELLPFEPQSIYPYLIISLFGVFFLTLYLVVFRQAKSYELYKYVRGDAE